MTLSYAVIGTGALGGYYGGRLAAQGCDVHFLARSDYQHIKDKGLMIKSVDKDAHIKPVQVYNNTEAMPACDVILVTLKTTNNSKLTELLPPILKPGSIVILIQNGLGVEDDLARALPGIDIAGALAYICATKTAPGFIEHDDYGRLTIGTYNFTNKRLMEAIGNDFKQAGVPIEQTDDLLLARWKKLVWNIPYNGLSVVLNATTQEMMRQADSRQLIHDIMCETINAAKACGLTISRNFADKMLQNTDNMTPYAPSMKVDFVNKRPMEVEYIYSRPIQAAQQFGYQMTKVTMLRQQLLFAQSTYTKNT